MLVSVTLVDEDLVVVGISFLSYDTNNFKYKLTYIKCTSLYTSDIALKNWMENEFSLIYCLTSSFKV